MQKRGQVTTFIVIGIVILLVVGGLVTYKYFFVEQDLEAQLDLHSRLPEEVKPVAQVLDSCVQGLAVRAVDTLGISGGYINAPSEDLPTNIFTPLSSSLDVLSGFSVPVWFRERPTGEQVLNIPTQNEMETQLQDYIAVNFDNCLILLRDFSDYTFSSTDINVNVKAEITDEFVDVIVNYPVNVEIKETEFVIDKHLGRVEAPLGRLHKNAVAILERENKDFFLEKKTTEMLVAYDDEVPYSGVDLECAEKIWSKSKVVSKLKEILQSNIASIRVKGTSYTNTDNYFVVDALSDTDENTAVTFMYSPSWPTYVEIDPSKGDILQGDTLSRGSSGFMTNVLSSFFCFSTHHFVYDIKYPVLVTLTDKNSDYMFNFATQVLIDNNQPRKNRIEPIVEETSNVICDNPQSDLIVRTGYTNLNGNFVSLDNAQVYYKCYPARCYVGESVNGAVGGAVPACVDGVVEAEKEGFYKGKAFGVSTNNEDVTQIEVELNKIYTKKVNLLVIDKETGEIREPYDDEEISFEFVNENGFVSRLIYPDGADSVDLTAGNYVITSYVLGSSTWPITTPKQKIENCVGVTKGGLLGVLGQEDEKCFSIETESMEFDTALKGGVKFEYSFDQNELASSDAITLYTMASLIPGDADGLMTLGLSIDDNVNDPRFRYPVI